MTPVSPVTVAVNTVNTATPRKSATPVPAAAAPAPATAPQQQAAAPEAQTSPMRETLEAIASDIQSYLQRNGRNLEFNVDDSSGRMVISVRDSNTGELIRQIPNKEALQISERLFADSGTLFDQLV